MAYYSDEQDKQDVNNPEGAVKPGSSVVSSAPGAGATNAPAETAKSSSPSGSKPSPFVGINEYLKANQSQAGKLGSTVNNYVGNKIDTANQKLGEAGNQFASDVDKNTVKLDENLTNQIKQDPTALTADPNKVQQVKNLSKAYAGPTDFQTSSQFQGVNPQLQKAQQASKDLTNQQGQNNVLTNLQLDTRGGKLNRGAATLDQGLLGGSKLAQANLAPAIEKGKTFQSNIDTAIQNAMNKVSGAQKTSSETNQAMKDLFSQQFGGLKSGLEQRATQANAQTKQRMSDIQDKVINNPQDLTAEELNFLGTDRGSLEQARNDFLKYAPNQGIAGAKGALGQYFSTQDPGANYQNIANAEDFARSQALAQLSGQDGILTGAGQGFNPDAINFDLAGLQNYINPYKVAGKQKEQEQQAALLAAQQAAQEAADREAVRKAMSGQWDSTKQNFSGNAVTPGFMQQPGYGTSGGYGKL